MKSTALFAVRALGWSLVAAVAAASLFLASAAWFAGLRPDSYFRPLGGSDSEQDCQCRRAAAPVQA